jgi:hypothetical protein
MSFCYAGECLRVLRYPFIGCSLHHRCFSSLLRRYHFNKVKTLSDAQQAKYVEYAKLLASCELYRISWSIQSSI